MLPITLCAQQGKYYWQFDEKIASALQNKLADDKVTNAFYPPNVQTVENVQLQLQTYGAVDGRLLAAILQNQTYLSSLQLEQVQDLALAFAQADGYAEKLRNVLFSQIDLLSVQNVQLKKEEAKNQKQIDTTTQLLAFYTMAAASLGHHPQHNKAVLEWAFSKVEKAALDSYSTQTAVWPSTALLSLAAGAMEGDWPYIMGQRQREQFELRLERVIRQFDWIKDQQTDYSFKGFEKRSWRNLTNQGVLITLFLQANNFFVSKDNENALKSWFVTGGLKNHELRFANDGSTFYISHPTPGTDGKGNFAESVNGRRHHILTQLVYALCVSYATRPGTEASDLVKKFTRRYFETDQDGNFLHYLGIALQSMRAGRELLENSFLEGWQAEEQALQKELYEKLKKRYKVSLTLTYIQGGSEVAAIWEVFYLACETVGVVAPGVAKFAQKTLFKMLPVRAGLGLIAFDISVKHIMRFTGNSMRSFLQSYGWKMAAAGAVGVGVSADSPISRPSAR